MGPRNIQWSGGLWYIETWTSQLNVADSANILLAWWN